MRALLAILAFMGCGKDSAPADDQPRLKRDMSGERVERATEPRWCSDAAHGRCTIEAKECMNRYGQCSIVESYVCMTLRNSSSPLACNKTRTQCMAELADPALDAGAYDCVVFRKGA